MKPHPCRSRISLYTALLPLLMIHPATAVNSLSVWSVGTHGTFPGFIDQTTAVIEPKSGYAVISLFLTYSDHNQFPGRNVEVLHLFDLPDEARVTDLWLWIGDSIMQARIYETPRAQQIYDSITSLKRDPAFLKLKNGQYELNVYPLESGSYRKVKLTYLVPINWIGSEPRIAIPLRMLQANSAGIKPLRVLFRTPKVGGDGPVMIGSEGTNFKSLPDTLGYRYFEAGVGDITGRSRLEVTYQPFFQGGLVQTTDRTDEGSLFSIGILPNDYFGLASLKGASRKILIGLDASGTYGPTPETMAAGLSGILPLAVTEGDSLKLMVAGDNRVETYPPAGWSSATPSAIAGLAEGFKTGAIAKSFSARKSRILVTDIPARHCWGFQDLEKIATVSYSPSNDLRAHLGRFREADAIASLTQGYEEKLSDAQAGEILDSLAPFFERGGTFLTYIDYNRRDEKIATRLIHGLSIPSAWNTASVLTSVPASPIGRGMPAALHHKSNFVLLFQDPDVTVEMVDGNNRPVVISKAIGRGRIVVSGIWSLQDADGIKKSLAIPMLGLQSQRTPSQFLDLIHRMSLVHQANPVSRLLVLSNSDTSYSPSQAEAAAGLLLGSFSSPRPILDAIHLLDGQDYIPPSVNFNGINYPGISLVLKTLAEKSGGQFLSLKTSSWEQMRESLRLKPYPSATFLQVKVTSRSSGTASKDIFEIAPNASDPEKPRFFIGKAPSGDTLEAEFRATFAGSDSMHVVSSRVPVEGDTTLFGTYLGAAMAGTAIQSLLQQSPLDTALVIRLAFEHRLVTDYTALLALEPNDSIHFIRDPKDESQVGNPVTGLKPPTPATGDTLGISAVYSPGSGTWLFRLSVPGQGKVEVAIFDLKGRRIREWKADVKEAGTLIHDFASTEMGGSGTAQLFAVVRFTPPSGSGRKPIVKTARSGPTRNP